MTEETITTEKARSGHAVMKKNGKWLASSIDPVREAQQWSDTVRISVEETETIIVLGLGCGYHVVELLKICPKSYLLIIECDLKVKEKALQFCPALADASIVVEANWMNLVSHSMIRDALGGAYRVVKHAPSFAIGALESEYFEAVDGLLRGRDMLSFLHLLKVRPEILCLLDTELLGDTERFQGEAMSIKTMQKLFTQRPNTSRERRLWRVLEELVL